MQLYRDKQMDASYQALARQSPNKAFYWSLYFRVIVNVVHSGVPPNFSAHYLHLNKNYVAFQEQELATA